MAPPPGAQPVPELDALCTKGRPLTLDVRSCRFGSGLTKSGRALELETLGRFYQLYGEFYQVWKLWTIYKNRSKYLTGYQRDSETLWRLLERAAEVEGGFESLLVRLTQERALGQEFKRLASHVASLLSESDHRTVLWRPPSSPSPSDAANREAY
jgi:hypothetical protein